MQHQPRYKHVIFHLFSSLAWIITFSLTLLHCIIVSFSDDDRAHTSRKRAMRTQDLINSKLRSEIHLSHSLSFCPLRTYERKKILDKNIEKFFCEFFNRVTAINCSGHGVFPRILISPSQCITCCGCICANRTRRKTCRVLQVSISLFSSLLLVR